MISMQLSKADAKDEAGIATPSDADLPKYPYGLSLCLDDELMMKLGLSELPKVGTNFTLQALVTVTSVRSNAQQDEVDSSIDLQITDMELGLAQKTNDDRATKLWPDSK